MMLKLLILGGTAQAAQLAERLGGDGRFAVTYSLAGRTEAPRLPPVATRIGGFGGAEGLAAYLRDQAIDVLIDATHPFAERISANARAAAGASLIVLRREPWKPTPEDRWTEVASLEAAASALPVQPSRVFLTVGRQSLVPFAARPEHHYVIRVIDPPVIPPGMDKVDILVGRGPFQLTDEIALMRQQRIACLVTKNSGGEAAFAKIEAARALGLPVILVAPPEAIGAEAFGTIGEVVEELERRHGALANRSV